METAHAPVAPEASLKVFVFSRRSGNAADAGRALETLTLWKMCGRSRIHTSSYGIPLKINGDTDTADEEQQPEHRDVTPPRLLCLPTPLSPWRRQREAHVRVSPRVFWDKYRWRLGGGGVVKDRNESVPEAQKRQDNKGRK